MNAGGVPNTCKSNGADFFESELSGERVSNTWMICPEAGDNSSKGLLIPHKLYEFRSYRVKEFISLREESVSHQLVGKVKAYQGEDG